MLQTLKTWAGWAMHQGRTGVNTDLPSLGEELDDLNEWRTGQYGWVNKSGKPGPYLQYIRGLSALSEHHYLLADFMDVGTIPSRWHPNEPGGYPEDIVTREYPRDDTEIRSRAIGNSDDLKSILSGLQVDASLKLRLFVVEDLSREVIETLGYHLKIHPSVFGDHLIDSRWDRLDDEHLAPPRLRTSILKQSWYTLRYVTARHFLSSRFLEQGAESVGNFNILRRLKDDDNRDDFWDQESRVGLIQNKATLWVQRPAEASDINSNMKKTDNPSVAVLLLDPTIRQGNPLWLKTRNWTQVPPMGKPPPRNSHIPEDNIFEHFIHWAERPEAFECLSTDSALAPTWIPTQILFHIICSQWLTLIDYLETRLNQIEREIAFPDKLIDFNVAMTERYNRLVTWHRMIPAFRKMIHDMGLLPHMALSPLEDGGIWHMQLDCNPETESTRASQDCHCRAYQWKNPYQLDISKLCDRMMKYSDQVDRLIKLNKVDGSVKRTLARRDNSRRMVLMIWLTILWILGPFLAHVLTVTTHPVSELVPSLRVWAAVAVPITLALVLGLRLYTA